MNVVDIVRARLDLGELRGRVGGCLRQQRVALGLRQTPDRGRVVPAHPEEIVDERLLENRRLILERPDVWIVDHGVIMTPRELKRG